MSESNAIVRSAQELSFDLLVMGIVPYRGITNPSQLWVLHHYQSGPYIRHGLASLGSIVGSESSYGGDSYTPPRVERTPRRTPLGGYGPGPFNVYREEQFIGRKRKTGRRR
jgi:hypothetical protein